MAAAISALLRLRRRGDRSDTDQGKQIGLFQLTFGIFKPYPTALSQTATGTFDSPKKTPIILETIVKPIVFRVETDQHTGRLSVTRNDDFLLARLTQITRKVVFDFRQGHFPYPGLPNWASHGSTTDLASCEEVRKYECS